MGKFFVDHSSHHIYNSLHHFHKSSLSFLGLFVTFTYITWKVGWCVQLEEGVSASTEELISAVMQGACPETYV